VANTATKGSSRNPPQVIDGESRGVSSALPTATPATGDALADEQANVATLEVAAGARRVGEDAVTERSCRAVALEAGRLMHDPSGLAVPPEMCT
jgi:hypothetical protein